MATAALLDFERLLPPIPGANPAGADLRTDPTSGSAYYLIKDTRSAARAAERQQVAREEDANEKRPDWRPVLEHGTKALAEKTKDLEITAYIIEALVRLHGFAGLRDGFRLAREQIERFWEKLYPIPDEEGLEARVSALTSLNGDDAEGTLIAPIGRVPITEATSAGRMTAGHYQDVLALGKITDPKLRDKKLAGGALSLEKFQKAIAETPPSFFRTLVEDLEQCQAELTKLDAALSQRCGQHAPPTGQLRAALASALDTVKEVARDKLSTPSTPNQAAATPAATANGAGPANITADGFRTREEAFEHLLKVADFFRRSEPQAVVSYALEQVVRWGRMSLPELLTELVPDESPRKNLFKQVGIRLAEPPKEAAKK
jgi:type VI secretion system protein ImpA